MNIFLHEIKAHRKVLIGWSIAMIFLIVAGMAKFTSIETGGQAVSDIFSTLPKPVLTILGIQGLDLNTVIGYFGVLYLYIQLTAAVHAAMLGSEIISKEERDRTFEFLYSKPVTRMRVLTEKIMAGLVNLILLNIVSLFTSIIMVALFANNFYNDDTISVLMGALFLMQLIFFTLGAALTAYFKNPKLPSIISTTVLLATYIIWVVIDLNSNLDFLKYLTPFHYFNASALIRGGRMDPLYVILSLVIISVLAVSTRITFNKRDLRV